MKNNNRISRINDEIMKELSQIIRSEVKDPRIGSMTTVIRVDTTTDLKYCKVFVSVLGKEEEKQSVMKGICYSYESVDRAGCKRKRSTGSESK